MAVRARRSRRRALPRPIVSIVILCHNDGRYLEGCLRSLRRHTSRARTPYELILVNNGSRDGSERFLRRAAAARGTRLIENRTNRYFAGGNNQGIRVARGRHVVLLNADTRVGPEWLERLLACADRDSSIGLVGPCTNGAVGDQLVREPGYRTPSEFFRFAKRWARVNSGASRPVHRLTAFCLLVTGAALRRVGLLDERFGPGGYEDYDYCLRAARAGFAIHLAEDVFVHHYGGRGYVGMDYDALRARNRELLARKWCAYSFEALDEIDRFLGQGGAPAARAPSANGRSAGAKNLASRGAAR